MKNEKRRNNILYSLLVLSTVAYLTAFTSFVRDAVPVKSKVPGPEQWEGYKSWYKITKTPNTGDPTGFLDKKHRGTGALRDIYINDIGKATNLGEADFPYPEGTVIVKEAFKNQKDYDAQKKPELTVMVKLASGTSPSTNDWMFYMGGDGKLSGTGMDTKWGKFCGSCHINAIAGDFTFMNHTFKK